MVENARGTAFTPPRRRFDMRDFSRLATWGLAALGALTIAAYAASSEIGEDRLILAVASIRGVPPPERLARAPSGSADAPARRNRSRVVRRPRPTAGAPGQPGTQRRRRHQLDRPRRQQQLHRPPARRHLSSRRRSSTPAAARRATPHADSRSSRRGAGIIATDEPAASKNRVRRRPRPGEFRRRPAPALERHEEPARRRAGRAAARSWRCARLREPAASNCAWSRARSPMRRPRRGCAPLLPGAACHPTVFDGQRLALR